MKKSALSMILVVSMLTATLAGCGGSPAISSSASTSSMTSAAIETPSESTSIQKRELSIAHCMSESDPYHLGVAKFVELVEDASGGNITFTIFPSGQLGGERDVAEGVAMGTVDVALCTNSVVVSLDSDLGVLDFPYLFESKQEAYDLLDGEFGKYLMSTLDAAGIHGLGFMENGFRVLSTSKQVVTPSDMAGMKIRTMENPIHMTSFNAAGANATPLAWADTYTALQQGTADGQENPLKSIYDGSIYEVTPYIAMTEHFYTAADLIMNRNLWNTFTDAEKDIFTQCAIEAVAYQRECCATREEEVIGMMKEKGITFSDVDKGQWKAAMAPVYSNADLSSRYGDLLDKLLSNMGKKLSDFTG